MTSLSKDRYEGTFLPEAALLTIVITAVVLYGAVETWSIAIVATVTAAAFIYGVMTMKALEARASGMKSILLAALLLAAYPLFQMLPLPLTVLGSLHPRLKEIVTISPDVSPLFHSVSVYPYATEMAMMNLLLYFMIFAIAAFGIRSEGRVVAVMKGIVIFGFVMALFAIIQKATWNGKIYWVRKLRYEDITATGPFVNRNHFAGFINMVIPFALGAASMARSKEKKMMYAFLAAIMTLSLFISLSRGGLISFLAGIMVFSFIVFTRGRSRKKLVPLFLFVLMLAIVLFYVGIEPVIQPFLNRFEKEGLRLEGRLDVWLTTIQAVKDFPVFGTGLGTFQHVFKTFEPHHGVRIREFYDHAHNDYLELLLETGIVGTVIAGLFLFTVLRAVLRKEWSGRGIYLQAACLSSLATIAVHSISDFNLHIPSNAIVLSAVLGISVALSRMESDPVSSSYDTEDQNEISPGRERS